MPEIQHVNVLRLLQSFESWNIWIPTLHIPALGTLLRRHPVRMKRTRAAKVQNRCSHCTHNVQMPAKLHLTFDNGSTCSPAIHMQPSEIRCRVPTLLTCHAYERQ